MASEIKISPTFVGIPQDNEIRDFLQEKLARLTHRLEQASGEDKQPLKTEIRKTKRDLTRLDRFEEVANRDENGLYEYNEFKGTMGQFARTQRHIVRLRFEVIYNAVQRRAYRVPVNAEKLSLVLLRYSSNVRDMEMMVDNLFSAMETNRISSQKSRLGVLNYAMTWAVLYNLRDAIDQRMENQEYDREVLDEMDSNVETLLYLLEDRQFDVGQVPRKIEKLKALRIAGAAAYFPNMDAILYSERIFQNPIDGYINGQPFPLIILHELYHALQDDAAVPLKKKDVETQAAIFATQAAVIMYGEEVSGDLLNLDAHKQIWRHEKKKKHPRTVVDHLYHQFAINEEHDDVFFRQDATLKFVTDKLSGQKQDPQAYEDLAKSVMKDRAWNVALSYIKYFEEKISRNDFSELQDPGRHFIELPHPQGYQSLSDYYQDLFSQLYGLIVIRGSREKAKPLLQEQMGSRIVEAAEYFGENNETPFNGLSSAFLEMKDRR